MRPRRIILVRHGESQGNVDKAKYATTPDFALKLTSSGIEQAKRAGAELKALIGDGKIYVYSSPYFRTRETFQFIRESIEGNLTKAIEDPRIREQDWGHLRHPDENKDIDDYRNNYSTFYYRIPDGESGADVYDRVSSFLDTLYRDFEKPDFPENILIVTHGYTLRIFLMRWFHWSVEEFESLKNPDNCQIVVMEKKDDKLYKLTTELGKKK